MSERDHVCTRWSDHVSDLVNDVLEAMGRQAMARVDEQINSKTAAPELDSGAAPNTAVHLEGATAMSSIPHGEDISVLGAGVIHLPLLGRPEFKGLIDGADGPVARIQDGDLVLTVDDVATLRRWSKACALAAEQLGAHKERLAAHRENGAA